MAFVRLSEAVLLESVLEVPVPVRFIFVLLGPSQSNVDYHEIGRSFSTLMSDKVASKSHSKALRCVIFFTNNDNLLNQNSFDSYNIFPVIESGG